MEDSVAMGLCAIRVANTAAQDDNGRAEMKIQLPSLSFRATKMQWLNMPVTQALLFSPEMEKSAGTKAVLREVQTPQPE